MILEFARKPKHEHKPIWICDGNGFINDDGNYVSIHYDYDATSPREFADDFSQFYTWLRSYGSPDKCPDDIEDLFAELDLIDEWQGETDENYALLDAYYDAMDGYHEAMEHYESELADYEHRVSTNRKLNELERQFAEAMGRPFVETNHFDWMGGSEYVEPVKPIEPDYPDLDRPCDRCNPIMWLVGKLVERGYAALPVSAYIHSGISYGVGTPSQFPDAQWDAGWAGLIFASPESIKRNYMVDEISDDLIKRVNTALRDEVELFSEWASGNCHGFVVHDQYGDEIDSCWGFIGSDAVANGMTDYTGNLHETSLSLDDWLAECEEQRELQEQREEEEFMDKWPYNMGRTTAMNEHYAA